MVWGFTFRSIVHFDLIFYILQNMDPSFLDFVCFILDMDNRLFQMKRL